MTDLTAPEPTPDELLEEEARQHPVTHQPIPEAAGLPDDVRDGNVETSVGGK